MVVDFINVGLLIMLSINQTLLFSIISWCRLFFSSTFILLFSVLSFSSDVLSAPTSPIVSSSLVIADFATEKLENWQSKSFVGETEYTIVNEDDKTVLKAYSQNSASALAKEITIDLLKTPFFNWSWKIENGLPNLDEITKDGDDYAARLYLVKSGGWKIWNTRALIYVWSSNQQAGSIWNNAFVGDNAKMLSVKGKEDTVSVWATEKRNVYKDLILIFGDKGSEKDNQEAYRYLDAVAIMTDTDNSQLNATAYYSNIYFSAN